MLFAAIRTVTCGVLDLHTPGDTALGIRGEQHHYRLVPVTTAVTSTKSSQPYPLQQAPTAQLRLDRTWSTPLFS